MREATAEQRLTPAGFFVLRTPLLAFDEFLRWSEGLEAVALLDEPVHFEDAYQRDCERLRSRLNNIVTRREVREALFLASPNLIERFNLWIDDPCSERGRKVEQVLVRYFARMTGRATPFGLFAGVSTGVVGDKTKLLLAGHKDYQRCTRLGTSFLSSLTDSITHDAKLRKNLRFRPNNSLYPAGGRLHYVESRINETDRSYQLVAVEETEYLTLALERSQTGATPAAIAAALQSDGITLDDASDFVAELIDTQLLVPDIGLTVSGPLPSQSLIEQLRKANEAAPIAEVLQDTQEKLRSFDRAGLGVDLDRYQVISRSLQSLPAKVELSKLFHADLVKPAPQAMLGQDVLKEIERGIRLMHRLSPGRQENDLTRFRQAFFKRYEESEVPLVEALDEEIGVGFGHNAECSPLLEDVDLFNSEEEKSTDERNAFKLRKLSEALSVGAKEINLTKSDVEGLALSNPDPLPDPLAIIATLSARTQMALAHGDFRILIDQGSGPSAALSMGRFCHADEHLLKHVKTLIRNEESRRPDAVFAEIVHLPEGKLGNIASRPQMRDYEIPFLARSTVDCEHQIPLTDLLVSITNNRIKLRSDRLDREVIPRMTNAHNYSFRSPGVYRFLCMLQNQGTALLLGWDWDALATAPYLPRVCSGRLVLSPARWNVTKEELVELAKEKRAARFRAVQSWRKRRGFPRFVTLAEQDNHLLIDLDNVLSVESFVQLVKERQAVTLLELFPSSDELCASGPEGVYVHELIVPFNAEQFSSSIDSTQPALEVQTRPQTTLTRRFLPASEWLYVKLYTGPATSDRVLSDLVKPLIKDLKNERCCDRWFFIRLSDPEFHLRLRFHGEPDQLRDRLQPKLKDALTTFVEDKRIWRVQFDTYEREVERYGGDNGVVLAEQFFEIDSEAVLQLLEVLSPGDSGLDERWRLTLYGIDRLMDDFGFDINIKHSISRELRDQFAEEFKVDQPLWVQLNEKFRAERNALQKLLNPGVDSNDVPGAGLAVIESRSRQMSGVIRKLRLTERDGRLSRSLRQLLPSYIHMFVNRLLRSAHRPQELVIYHLLTKLYESQLKRL